MSYFKTLSTSDIAINLFNIIKTLSETPYEEHLYNLMEESKSALRKILMTSSSNINGYKYYSYICTTVNTDLTSTEYKSHTNYVMDYYQNGLCTYNNNAIDLGEFECINNNEQTNNIEIKNIDKIANTYPFVGHQLKNIVDNNYKVSKLYNGMRGSLETIIYNLNKLQQDSNDITKWNDEKQDVFNELKLLASSIIKQLSTDKTFYILDSNKISEYLQNQQLEDYLIAIDISDDVITNGKSIIKHLKQQDINTKSIARRLGLLNSDK